jgi:hypothetical protein
VRFGVSPFGIWRPGYPESVRGFDQYAKLYADARKWLREGWVDYFTPQLYWAVNKPEQSYPVLLKWWVEQNTKGRNIWPGNYTGKVGFTNSSKWAPEEVIDQVRLTRAQPGATGNVHFSMKVFLDDPDNVDERLMREVYTGPALVPASPWLDRRTPAQPRVAVVTDSASGLTLLDIRPGDVLRSSDAAAPASSPWLWVVQVHGPGGWTTGIIPATDRLFRLPSLSAPASRDARVTAVDRVGNAGPAARVNWVVVQKR